jgi:hypothetical protein
MAVTTGSFSSGPDKHILGSAAKGPSATGDYSDVGSPNAASSSTDDAAADIYGDPGDGTRMNRVTSIVKEALSETPNGLSGSDNANDAFIDGSTVSSFSTGYKANPDAQAAETPGAPGFPGLPDVPAAQGRDIQASKAVTASSSVSNNPAVKGSPGFPGLP